MNSCFRLELLANVWLLLLLLLLILDDDGATRHRQGRGAANVPADAGDGPETGK